MAHSRIELSGSWVLGLLALAGVSAGLAAAPPAVAAPGDITTVAGTTSGFSGDGGPATSAQLGGPTDVAIDDSGNFYIADLLNYRVRKVDASGTITTVAGTGTSGFSGDGGPATSAELGYPSGVAVDDSGNLYIADNNNHRVRKVDSSGTITTVAGTSSACGFSGDGGPAASAQLCWPWGVTVDDSGNLYIADSAHQRVRKVDGSGTITTVAGTGSPGFSGDGGLATSAELYNPTGLRVDSSGNLYIVDSQNERVRKVDGSGTITTVAGTGPPDSCDFSGDGGLATSARLCAPEDVAVDDSGNLYIADVQNNRVRKVDGSGTITTVAGTGTSGFSGDGGPATSAQLYYPEGVAVDGAGNLYIADQANRRIRKVEGTAAESPTFTVSSTDDTNDGLCGTVHCSLREAINRSNSEAGADTIDFDISPSGPQTIIPASGLPEITDPVTIDATTQPGYVDKPIIELDGTSAGATSGLKIGPAGGGSTIRGLIVNRFAHNGIVVGSAAGDEGSSDNVIAGNFIGTNAAGTADQGNTLHGVVIADQDATGNRIGGTTAADRNVISGNNSIGVVIEGPSSGPGANTVGDNVVEGNYIGTDLNGTSAVGNGHYGVVIQDAFDNTIGGTAAGAGNLISGNLGGVRINNSTSTGNVVEGNSIGTNAAGTGALANSQHGVNVAFTPSSNTIGGTAAGAGNLIANNGRSGVFIERTSTGVKVSSNSIYSNAELGIDLQASTSSGIFGDGVSANDSDDPDGGGNDLQNFPVLTSTTTGGGQTNVAGTLNSEASTTYRLEFFSSPGCDSSGNGEGKTLVGSADVSTDGGGDATFSETFSTSTSVGDLVTATATDPAGNSSEFSACRTVAVDPQTTINSGPSGATNDPTPTFTFSPSEAGFQCKLDGGAYSPCTSPKTTAHLADGSHTFSVRATDPAGNVDPTPAVRTFTVRTAQVNVTSGQTTLVVAAAPGAKDNLAITRPSPSVLRVTDLPGGAYTGSGVRTGAGCTRSGDYTANCSAAGITRIVVLSKDQIDKVVNSTAIKSSLNGGAANDVLTGGSANDTLTGSTGADVFKGMNGNDELFARDLTSDTTINCDGGTTPGAADRAVLDSLPKDPNSSISGCETVRRP